MLKIEILCEIIFPILIFSWLGFEVWGGEEVLGSLVKFANIRTLIFNVTISTTH